MMHAHLPISWSANVSVTSKSILEKIDHKNISNNVDSGVVLRNSVFNNFPEAQNFVNFNSNLIM